MNRLDRYKKNIELLTSKYNTNIEPLYDTYVKRREKVTFKCNKHNHIFKSSLSILLDSKTTCGCPLCCKEKLSLSGKRGVIIKKNKPW